MYHMCGFMAFRCSKSATLARLAMLQATVRVWLYAVRKCLFMYFFLLLNIFLFFLTNSEHFYLPISNSSNSAHLLFLI